MTYDQVVAIVGSSPSQTRSVTTGQYANTGTEYEWDNADGSKMTVIFVNGTVVGMAILAGGVSGSA